MRSEGEVGVVGLLPGKGEEGWAKARYTTAGCCDNVESRIICRIMINTLYCFLLL